MMLLILIESKGESFSTGAVVAAAASVGAGAAGSFATTADPGWRAKEGRETCGLNSTHATMTTAAPARARIFLIGSGRDGLATTVGFGGGGRSAARISVLDSGLTT